MDLYGAAIFLLTNSSEVSNDLAAPARSEKKRNEMC